jgi:outer membrane protein OmpA-like peptidoglycan-associated protein
MEQRQPQPTRNPSRTMAKVAVAVLIVIAIAGFVLAGLKPRAAAPAQGVASDATQETAPALTPPASAAGEDAGAAANQISFAPASDKLSDAASAKLVVLADKAKKGHLRIAIVSDVEARADRNEQLALVRRRAEAVRQVLVTNGIPLATMRIEIHEVPSGAVSPADANRLMVALQ